jgi:hypothetical protein
MYRTPSDPFQLSHITLTHVFPLLIYATNLEVFYMNVSIYQSFLSKADVAARSFYEKAHWWLWAMVLYKRNLLEILKLPEVKIKNTGNAQWMDKQWPTTKKGQDKFLTELGARLVMPAFDV